MNENLFLKCIPSVFVIGKEYEILVIAQSNGIIGVRINGEIFYENNTGVLSSEKNFAKIRVQQEILDNAKKYQIVFRKTIDRKGYFSQFEDEIRTEFCFKPLSNKSSMNVYHVADVHLNFENAIKTCSYFGESLDLLIVNGDIGELESDETYFKIAKFVGDVSCGQIPVIFARGNHDTRGKLVERYTDYFPANEKNTFFTFDLGCFNGVVLDCGEDKLDTDKEYGGANVFSSFRKRQTRFLESISLNKKKIRFVVSHICPNLATLKEGDLFDIERDTYTEWTNILEREKIDFMLCGHVHKAFVLEPNNNKSIIKHNFPIIIGSAVENGNIIGTAIVLSKNKMTIKFTDSNKKVILEKCFILD